MSTARFILIAGALLVLIFSAPTSSSQTELMGKVKVSSDIRPTDLVVYLANPPRASKFSSPAKVSLNQRNKMFDPHVLAIVKGTTVEFLNSDRLTHNVFSFSPSEPFDLGKIPPNGLKRLTFEKPGVVEVLCGFHPHMLAYIHVMEHPYFAVPDAEGRFIIKNVPPGTYQLHIWHEVFKETSSEVKVTEDQSLPIQLRFPK